MVKFRKKMRIQFITLLNAKDTNPVRTGLNGKIVGSKRLNTKSIIFYKCVVYKLNKDRFASFH